MKNEESVTGCRYCGWDGSHGFAAPHKYTPPAEDQLKQRMKFRRVIRELKSLRNELNRANLDAQRRGDLP